MRRSQNFVYPVHLIQLIFSGEQREECDYFEHDAADAPEIHLIVVVPVGHQTFGSAVPPGRNVLRVGLVVVDTLARTEVGQLEVIALEQDVFAVD